MRTTTILPAVLIVSLLGGCAARMSQKQLEDVARDWCMTIRASQVIPVYPLTEDLQPGDVFLVQTPLQKQEELYKDRGFLPLDQMVTRLHHLDYGEFYNGSYFKWYYDSAPGAGMERPKPDSDPSGRRFDKAPLPMAAFPTYSFAVESKQGIRVALPVQGIAVGLGLMQTDSASGTITLTDGMTYAIHAEEVLTELHDWVKDTDVRRTLAEIRHQTPNPIYLRVVTRVYLVGAVTVSLTNNKEGAGGLDVGQHQQIEFTDSTRKESIQPPTELSADAPESEGPESEDASAPPAETEDLAAASAAPENVKASQASALETISENLQSAAPGGSFRFAYASGRAVVMHERFPRLLAVGYLGFDVPVLRDGSLGAPVATLDAIQGEIRLRHLDPLRLEVRAWDRVSLTGIYQTLDAISKEDGADAQYAGSLVAMLDRAAESQLPDDLAIPIYGDYSKPPAGIEGLQVDLNAGDPFPRTKSAFRDLISYWALLDTSIGAIEDALPDVADDQEENTLKLILCRTTLARDELVQHLNDMNALDRAIDLWRAQTRR